MTAEELNDFCRYAARKFISQGLTAMDELELAKALKNTLRGNDEVINRS